MIITVSTPQFSIKNFTILGERHCGTKFLQEFISKTFNLDITYDYGFKHFFGFNNSKIVSAYNTLFIGIVRNPYDWIMAMKKIPHHIPSENQASIQRLISREWYSIDLNGQEIITDRNYLDGQRYKNIFDMRYHKTQYLINTMPVICKNYIFIRYEDLLSKNSLIKNLISRKFYLRCSDYIPKIITKKPYEIDSEILQEINSGIDWTNELLMDYYPK
jgi:hypothetical protein